jgi:hypothetical protein
MKKKTGGGSDSTSVAPKQLVGMRKRSDNSTDYNSKKIHDVTKLPKNSLTGESQMVPKSVYKKYNPKPTKKK